MGYRKCSAKLSYARKCSIQLLNRRSEVSFICPPLSVPVVVRELGSGLVVRGSGLEKVVVECCEKKVYVHQRQE